MTRVKVVSVFHCPWHQMQTLILPHKISVSKWSVFSPYPDTNLDTNFPLLKVSVSKWSVFSTDPDTNLWHEFGTFFVNFKISTGKTSVIGHRNGTCIFSVIGVKPVSSTCLTPIPRLHLDTGHRNGTCQYGQCFPLTLTRNADTNFTPQNEGWNGGSRSACTLFSLLELWIPVAKITDLINQTRF